MPRTRHVSASPRPLGQDLLPCSSGVIPKCGSISMNGAVKSYLTLNGLGRTVLESKMISRSCAWQVQRGRHQPRLGSLKAWSSRQCPTVIYICPICRRQGAWANHSVSVCLRASPALPRPQNCSRLEVLGNEHSWEQLSSKGSW